MYEHPRRADDSHRGRRVALWLLGVLIVVCLGCSPPAPPDELALQLVVRSMVSLVPEKVADEPRRYFSSRFQAPVDAGPVPSSVLEAPGLMPLLDPLPRDSIVVLLNLFRPRVLAVDSIVVHAEWLVFEEGAPSFWGTAWEFVFKCGRECTEVSRSGPGHLN